MVKAPLREFLSKENVRAFVFIKTRPGKAWALLDKVKGLREKDRGVAGAFVVTGTYDIVALVWARNNEALLRLVDQRIHALPGIITNQTAVAEDSIM